MFSSFYFKTKLLENNKESRERIAEEMDKLFLERAPLIVESFPGTSGSFKIAYTATLERKGVKP